MTTAGLRRWSHLPFAWVGWVAGEGPASQKPEPPDVRVILTRPSFMAETPTVEIPDRPLFKAAEVCELVKVQPYVLRTWEAEFPELGEAKATGSGRVYRRGDVERVLRIKHLLLVEGLTLAGARRRMEADESGAADAVTSTPAHAAPASHAPARSAAVMPPLSLGADARERVRAVKSGLQSLLAMLDANTANLAAPVEFTLEPVEGESLEPAPATAKGKGERRAAGAKPSPSPRRKRSS